MSAPATLSRRIHFGNSRAIRPPQQPAGRERATGRIPRVARLLALAIRFEDLVTGGVVMNYAELARLGYVSRARVTQIMNLLQLAPQIQEEVLFLPAQSSGRDTITERALRSLVAEPDWRVQRRLWRRMRRHDYKSCNKQGASLP